MYGFKPSSFESLYLNLFKAIIKISGLNGQSRLASSFIQLINPLYRVNWSAKDKDFLLKFRTGHGRLHWRAATLHTEEPMMIKWLKTFNEKDVFLDLGANVGTYSIPGAIFSKICYSVELDPINIGILKENIILNGLTQKIIILPFPATELTELVNVHFRDFSYGDALQSVGRQTPFETVKGKDAHEQIQLGFSLDDIWKLFKLLYPTRIKIDVDGNEISVLAGAWNVVKNAKEIYFEHSGLSECDEIIEKLVSEGFAVVEKEIPHNAKGAVNVLLRKI